jgi:hypothetical protein
LQSANFSLETYVRAEREATNDMSFEAGGRCSYANATLGMEVEAPELRISSGRVAYRPDDEE